ERVLMLHRRHLHAEARAVAREAAPLPADSSACLVSALVGREPSPRQQAGAPEVAEQLRLALGRLDEDERRVTLGRHLEHLSNEVIAGLLGVSEAASAEWYVRALERLRGLLLALGVCGPR